VAEIFFFGMDHRITLPSDWDKKKRAIKSVGQTCSAPVGTRTLVRPARWRGRNEFRAPLFSAGGEIYPRSQAGTPALRPTLL